MAAPTELIITQPDDWHLHLRDGEGLTSLGKLYPPTVHRAIIMPNLRPPVTTTTDALGYRDRILKAMGPDSLFKPLMTLYLTDKTPAEEIEKAHASGIVYAVKLYPAGATTNSDSGVTDFTKVQPALDMMAKLGMPLCVHGEVTDKTVDIFEREPVFLERVFEGLISKNPNLKIVLEHITTKEAVAFVMKQGPNIAATITAHHLLYSRNALFDGGLRPHMYCLPVLKHENDRKALLEAITSGNPRFFMGTDSAPHVSEAKCSSCGCAGVYTAHAALEFYTTAFEEAGCLQNLDSFVSEHGAKFYGLPRNERKVRLTKETWTIPESYEFGQGVVVPLGAGNELGWKAALLD